MLCVAHLLQSLFAASLLSSFAAACFLDHAPPTQDEVDIYRNGSQPRLLRTALVNVRPFDGYTILPPRTVYIENGTIVPYIAGAEEIVDGHGGVLLPGLIDSHCHPDTVTNLEALSSYGVTTAMGMSCANYTKCHALRSQSQQGLTSYFFAGHSAQGPNSTHALNFNTSATDLIYGPWQAHSFADYVFGNGSDALKIVSELNGPSLETQRRLVAAAHGHGKKAMTHASELSYYENAILSGTDGIQHAPGDGLINATMFDLMIANRQFATPTLEVARLLLTLVRTNPSLGPSFGFGANDSYANWRSNVIAMHKAAVPILAGTDSANYPAIPESTFGWSLHEELANLVDAGLSNEEALRSATILPSLLHGLSDRGRIESGFRADLVLLEPGASPLTNITHSRKIARVWNGGAAYEKVANQSIYSSSIAQAAPP